MGSVYLVESTSVLAFVGEISWFGQAGFNSSNSFITFADRQKNQTRTLSSMSLKVHVPDKCNQGSFFKAVSSDGSLSMESSDWSQQLDAHHSKQGGEVQ